MAGRCRVKSNLSTIKQEHIRRVRRKGLHVGRGSLPLRARKSILQRRHIVKMQGRDQMKSRWPRRCHNRTFTDFVFPKPGNFLRDRNVCAEIMFVECCRILRRLVHHHQSSHHVSPHQPFYCVILSGVVAREAGNNGVEEPALSEVEGTPTPSQLSPSTTLTPSGAATLPNTAR